VLTVARAGGRCCPPQRLLTEVGRLRSRGRAAHPGGASVDPDVAGDGGDVTRLPDLPPFPDPTAGEDG
jgi:hypothetical protein